jgi:hypothetical protein
MRMRKNEAKTIIKILVLYIREGNKGQMKTKIIVNYIYTWLVGRADPVGGA